jgi:hypothetical protein
VLAVSQLAIDSETALGWLAKTAEPGLLSAVSKNPAMPCARLHVLWTNALQEREAAGCSALTVPIKEAVHRCGAAMDGVLADAFTHLPTAKHGCIVQGIDPFAAETAELKATCAVLPNVASRAGQEIDREHARDVLANGCQMKR